ncbi:VOC family protein [Janibacter indicus]|uniref:VOC family protein n=1 Tax=Janibacter indicus TaxID=857417 RepID=UPI003EC08FA4
MRSRRRTTGCSSSRCPARLRQDQDALRPAATDATQDEEAERLLAHGASLHDDLRGKYGPGTGWVTLADPEGNLFCVLRSDGELAARD